MGRAGRKGIARVEIVTDLTLKGDNAAEMGRGTPNRERTPVNGEMLQGAGFGVVANTGVK